MLYCLAAVIVFAFFALTTQSSESEAASTLVEREIETAAHGVAQRWSAQVKARAFDEADTAGGLGLRTTTAGLTASPAFGPDDTEAGLDQFDDVDDFDGLAIQDTALVGAARDRPVAFDVTAAVTYRTDALGVSTSATLTKEVALTVTEVGAVDRPPVRIEVPVHVTAASQHLRTR